MVSEFTSVKYGLDRSLSSLLWKNCSNAAYFCFVFPACGLCLAGTCDMGICGLVYHVKPSEYTKILII